MKPTIIKILLLILLTACTVANTSTFHPQYVVQAYLIADNSLPGIRLSSTVAPGDKYVQRDVAVSDATLEVQLLKDDSGIEKVFRYQYSDNGIYMPDTNAIVLPGRTYKLYITFPGNNTRISAETTVPDAFKIISVSEDTVTYNQNEPIRFLASRISGSNNSKYLFNVISQNPITLTPYYKHQLDVDGNKTPAWYLNVQSGILNGSFFTQTGNDIELRLPWDVIAFYGSNLVIPNIIDTNLYDFIRSSNTSDENKQLSSGYINEIIYHIDGGIGIFGSMSRDSLMVYIKQ